jgi:hypothetical protein
LAGQAFLDGNVIVQNVSTGLCLNVAYASTAVGTHILTWPCNRTVNEQFRF